MMVSQIPHTQRTYDEEEHYFTTKTNMYQTLFWKVSDITKEINTKGATTLKEKEEIAKRFIKGSDEYSVSVYEEECNEDELEHRVHMMLTINDWTVDLGVLWIVDGTDNKAVRMYCEGADCDIQIQYDDDGHPMFEYVENPRDNIESYQQTEHCIWKFDMDNKNPFKEQWIVDAFQDTYNQSFAEYTEHFGIIDIENDVMPDLVEYIASLNDLNEESDDDELEEFIEHDMLGYCTDYLPDGYAFDVQKGEQDKYRDGFYVTCSLEGREIYRSGKIHQEGSRWIETKEEPSRKRKAVDDPET